MVLTPASQAPCKHSVEQAPVRLSGALKKVLCATPVYLITATSALPGSQAMAAPVVSGNLISWPDDGWYQVQRQDNYEAVCAGTRQCTVPAGTYIVINHDTGQRWPDTVVTGTSPVDGLVVSGNTLSWPDDGWYQVQRADTYAQVCAGTRACVVPEGTYNVINHTSGQRWENIPVEGAEGSPDGGVGADEEAPLPISELTYLLPPIVGTELPGQDVGRRTLHVDAFEAMRYYYQTPLLPDVDGDNIAELYVPVTEPGQACSSLLYLPSTQSYSPALDTTNLSPYTRIRNFSATPREDGSVHCPNDSQELHSLGDVDGDGISEIAVRYSYNGELVISGAVPWGSIVSADTPGQHAFFASDGMVISATGDVDGDGHADLGLRADSDDIAIEDRSCLIVSGDQTFPHTITSANVRDLKLIAQWPVTNESQRCPSIQSGGDVNGDGFDDLIVSASDEINNWHILEGGEAIRFNNLSAAYAVESECSQQGLYCDLRPIGDVDADGYDDAIIVWSRYGVHREPGQLRSTGVLLYGGADGLRNLSTSPFPPIRRSQIIVQSGQNRWPAQPKGDINGDGASDIGDDEFILLGSPGKRLPYLLPGLLNSNGVFREEDAPSYSTVSVDMDGDGIDDIPSRSRFVRGKAQRYRAADPASLLLWQAASHMQLHWTLPAAAEDTIDAVRLLWNDDLLARLDASVSSHRIDRSQDQQHGVVRVQTLDSRGNFVGEAVRHVGSMGPGYTDIEAQLRSREEQANGQSIEAIDYTVRAEKYSDTLAELFWDVTKRFVLVWRDDEIIARTEANSLMIDATTHGSGRYFVTIDYLGGMPDNTRPFVDFSGTLRRSNVVDINFDE